MVRPLRLVPLGGDCPNSVRTDFRPSHICDFITSLCCKQQRLEQGTERSGLAKQRPNNAQFVVRKHPSACSLLRIGPCSDAHKGSVKVELIIAIRVPTY